MLYTSVAGIFVTIAMGEGSLGNIKGCIGSISISVAHPNMV
jgi:hypothetical protein